MKKLCILYAILLAFFCQFARSAPIEITDTYLGPEVELQDKIIKELIKYVDMEKLRTILGIPAHIDLHATPENFFVLIKQLFDLRIYVNNAMSTEDFIIKMKSMSFTNSKAEIVTLDKLYTNLNGSPFNFKKTLRENQSLKELIGNAFPLLDYPKSNNLLDYILKTDSISKFKLVSIYPDGMLELTSRKAIKIGNLQSFISLMKETLKIEDGWFIHLHVSTDLFPNFLENTPLVDDLKLFLSSDGFFNNSDLDLENAIFDLSGNSKNTIFANNSKPTFLGVYNESVVKNIGGSAHRIELRSYINIGNYKQVINKLLTYLNLSREDQIKYVKIIFKRDLLTFLNQDSALKKKKFFKAVMGLGHDYRFSEALMEIWKENPRFKKDITNLLLSCMDHSNESFKLVAELNAMDILLKLEKDSEARIKHFNKFVTRGVNNTLTDNHLLNLLDFSSKNIPEKNRLQITLILKETITSLVKNAKTLDEKKAIALYVSSVLNVRKNSSSDGLQILEILAKDSFIVKLAQDTNFDILPILTAKRSLLAAVEQPAANNYKTFVKWLKKCSKL